tara:strand:- start:76 stop:234 length:159 start_codon:yes stop_codon:yes gene_type:complete
MRVKIFITIDIDDEEYPVPADGMVGEELEEGIQEYFYDIEGANIRTIRTITE